MRPFVGIEVMYGFDPVVSAGFDSIRDRIGADPTTLGLDLGQCRGSVVFGRDGTDRNAIVVTAAGRSAVIGDAAVTRLCGREILQPDPGSGLGKALLTLAER